jgi:hypothetical protein
MSDYSLRNLPSEVFASVLGKFCDGKAISTFLLVVCGDRTLRSTAYSICRGALVQRFIEISNNTQFVRNTGATCTEIRDVLDVIREEIRLSHDDDDQIMSKFSKWCAILDYFEIQLDATITNSRFRCPQWIVWCGQLELPYGEINGYLTTPDWNVCALQYWRNKEVSHLTLAHPRNAEYSFIAEYQNLYGALFGREDADRLRLQRQCSDLEVHTLRDTSSSQRFSLVPLNESYEECPSIVFVDHSFICRTHSAHTMAGPLFIDPQKQSICCCWDKEKSEDLWDDAISNFGEHAIRIMKSFGTEFSKTMLSELYLRYREFSNR